MKFRATWIFALIVAAVVAYTLRDYRKSKDEPQLEAGHSKLFPMTDDLVVGLSLSQGSNRLQLKKNENGWEFEQPIIEKADDSQVSALVAALLSETGEYVDLGSEPVDWSKYFLEPPGYKVDVIPKGGEAIHLEIGSSNAFDGRYYLRLGRKLYLGERSWAHTLDKDVDQLRNKILYNQTAEIENITIENLLDKQTLSFTRQLPATWTSDLIPAPEFDALKVDQFIKDLRTLQAQKFVANEVPQNKKLQNYRLQSPSLKVTVSFSGGTTRPWSLVFGQIQKGELFGYTNERAAVVQLPESSASKVFVVANSFRNGKRPFQFQVEQISQVELRTDLAQVIAQKSGQNWKLQDDVPGKELDGEKLADLFKRLSQLEAKDFVGGKLPKGVSATKNILRLKDTAGQLALQLSWGDEYKPKSGPMKDKSLVYLQSSLSQEVFGVSAEDIQALPGQSLLKDKATNESTKK